MAKKEKPRLYFRELTDLIDQWHNEESAFEITYDVIKEMAILLQSYPYSKRLFMALAEEAWDDGIALFEIDQAISLPPSAT